MVQKQLKHVRGVMADALRLSALRLLTLFLNGY
jgi:hypothetical protein